MNKIEREDGERANRGDARQTGKKAGWWEEVLVEGVTVVCRRRKRKPKVLAANCKGTVVFSTVVGGFRRGTRAQRGTER